MRQYSKRLLPPALLPSKPEKTTPWLSFIKDDEEEDVYNGCTMIAVVGIGNRQTHTTYRQTHNNNNQTQSPHHQNIVRRKFASSKKMDVHVHVPAVLCSSFCGGKDSGTIKVPITVIVP